MSRRGERRFAGDPPSSTFNVVSLTLGFAFLYLPILDPGDLFVQCVEAGDCLGWIFNPVDVALLQNGPLSRPPGSRLELAPCRRRSRLSSGTLAAIALVRFGRFSGRTLLTGMVYAPMVMPEVITGLSLLLLFVALDLDRGFWTVTLAHVSFTMCFVTVVVQSRLVTLDRSLEEAAMDLGATPLATFFQVTLPLIAPAVAAGWMLAFTLSLDDLVIASFTSGPGATTLPMRIYGQVRLGVSPEINAASTILIGFVALAIIMASLATKRGALETQPPK